MATTIKSSNSFEDAIRQYLDQRAESDNMFAIRYASPSKSVTECCQYIINEVKRMGVNVMTNDDVLGLAVHYFDGDWKRRCGLTPCGGEELTPWAK